MTAPDPDTFGPEHVIPDEVAHERYVIAMIDREDGRGPRLGIIDRERVLFYPAGSAFAALSTLAVTVGLDVLRHGGEIDLQAGLYTPDEIASAMVYPG